MIVPVIPAPVADVLSRTVVGNTLDAWMRAALTAAIVLFVGVFSRRMLVSHLGKLATRTTNQVDDMFVEVIAATKTWVIVVYALIFACAHLHTGVVAPFLPQVAKIAFLWQFAAWSVAAITFWVKHHLEHRTGTHDRTSIAMISAMGVGAKVLIWVLIFLTALSSVFGVAITPLITGLGVSGIAVALAVQNILGDLLAALAIVFDKPFDVGDSIGVDAITGTVEHIGLKTTRLRSVTGEQVIIGNGDLLKSRLRNFRRMYQRRVLFNLDVVYETGPDVLARIPRMVEEIVSAQKPVKFDRSHVTAFLDSAIRIETVYYVLDPDYKTYLDVQQAVNLEVLRRFNAEHIEFAFPSQTVYHEGLNAKDVPVAPRAPA